MAVDCRQISAANGFAAARPAEPEDFLLVKESRTVAVLHLDHPGAGCDEFPVCWDGTHAILHFVCLI